MSVQAEETQSKADGSQPNAEARKHAKQLERLNEYVQQMAYKPIKPPRASEHTESLARTRKRNIVGTYVEHKDDLVPKERAKRIKRIVSQYKTMTTDQLEDVIRQYRKKQARSQREKRDQQVQYHETLMKLQSQAEEQLMNSIVHKFAKKVAKRASTLPPPNVETESFQLLQNSLVCNMLMALNVSNTRQPHDYTIYVKLARVLADLIMQAVFRAQNPDNIDYCKDALEEAELVQKRTNDRCIQLRAIRAAKKLCSRKKLRSRCCFFSF